MEFLDDEAFEPGFLETPTETLVARIAETLELTPAAPPRQDGQASNGHDPDGHDPPADTS